MLISSRDRRTPSRFLGTENVREIHGTRAFRRVAIYSFNANRPLRDK